MADHNPYVGPASYQEDDRSRFFGRMEETRALTSLIIARRAVLLYAQSGAGKTSLLKAAVIPGLKDRKKMQVSPVARVGGGQISSGNSYVANALTTLLGNAPTDPTITLKQALAPLVASDPNATRRTPYLLVFDQFEEIFTWHPELYDHRRVFFEQLNDCLTEYTHVSLLLAMREDYLADLDSFAGFLPDRMRTRMRMEQLQHDQAVDAVRQPALIARKPFDDGVAEGLIDNLLQSTGKYVEPVQLQIVCWQLWSRLPENATSITADDVKQYGNVDDALTKFYEDSLAEALKASAIGERTLRRWFSEQVITPAGTRGLVYQGKSDTAGLPNDAVTALDKRFIIRPVKRGADTWYELAHDRLVTPILDANKNWLAKYRNPVADAYQRWVEAGRNSAKLLNGNQLVDAKAFAADRPLDLTDDERRFLTESEAEVDRVRKRRRTRRLTVAAVGIALIALAAWAVTEAIKAQKALVEVQKASAKLYVQDAARNADQEPDFALASAQAALRADPGSLPARAWLSSLLLNRVWWSHRATLSIKATPANGAGRFRGAIAFNSDARRVAFATGHQVVLWDADTGKLVIPPLVHPSDAYFLVFSPDGERIVTIDDSAARAWDVESGRELAKISQISRMNAAAFGPDSRTIAIVSVFPDRLTVWNTETGDVKWQKAVPAIPIGVTFTPDGNQILTLSAALISRWNAQTGAPAGTPVASPHVALFVVFTSDSTRLLAVHPDWTYSVTDVRTGNGLFHSGKQAGAIGAAAFSKDGRYIVTGDERTVRVWESASGRLLGIVTRGLRKFMSVAFSPDGSRIATGNDLSEASVWRTADGRAFDPPHELRAYSVPDNKKAANDDPDISSSALAFNPAGNQLVAVTPDHAAQIWETGTGRLVATLRDDDDGFKSVRFNCDGKRVLTAGNAGIKVWDASTGRQIQEIEHKFALVAAYSSDCKSIIAGTQKPTVYDAGTAKPKHEYSAFLNGTFSVGFSPDGSRVIISGRSGRTIVRSETSVDYTLITNGAAVSSAFSADGMHVVIASGEGAQVTLVRKLEPGSFASPVPIGQPIQHTAAVTSVAYSPDGSWVVTGSADKTARIWDAETGAPLGVPMVHPSEVLSVVVHPDGHQIATLAKDGVARLWTVILGDGTPKNSMMLADLAAAESGVASGVSADEMAQRVNDLRKIFGLEGK